MTTASPNTPAAEQDEPRAPCRRTAWPRWFAAFGLLVAVAYVAYERIGTTANVDTLEHTINAAGGSVVLGFTETQPGIVVVSALDRDAFEIDAVQSSNWATGTRTYVDIKTDAENQRIRLRGPVLTLIDEQGHVRHHDLDWRREDLDRVRRGIDCSTDNGKECGRAFAAFAALLSDWSEANAPPALHAFLSAHVQDLEGHVASKTN